MEEGGPELRKGAGRQTTVLWAQVNHERATKRADLIWLMLLLSLPVEVKLKPMLIGSLTGHRGSSSGSLFFLLILILNLILFHLNLPAAMLGWHHVRGEGRRGHTHSLARLSVYTLAQSTCGAPSGELVNLMSGTLSELGVARFRAGKLINWPRSITLAAGARFAGSALRE
mgnify:CR=1 FL=1